MAAALPSRPYILVVDDDEGIRVLASQALSRIGDVALAATTDEAIETLARGDVDAVVCDVHLPGMGGLAVYSWLVRNRPGAERNLVFMTGDNFDARMAHLVAIENVPCLRKPFRLRALLDAVGERLTGTTH